jgi:hypothetical protein
MYLPTEAVISLNQIRYTIMAIHNGRMIPASKRLADLWQGSLGLLSNEVHRHLAWQSDLPSPAWAKQILLWNLILLRNG